MCFQVSYIWQYGIYTGCSGYPVSSGKNLCPIRCVLGESLIGLLLCMLYACLQLCHIWSVAGDVNGNNEAISAVHCREAVVVDLLHTRISMAKR